MKLQCRHQCIYSENVRRDYSIQFYSLEKNWEHKRRGGTCLDFHQVERALHGWELNHQPLHSVWVPLNYPPLVWGHLGPYLLLFYEQ